MHLRTIHFDEMLKYVAICNKHLSWNKFPLSDQIDPWKLNSSLTGIFILQTNIDSICFYCSLGNQCIAEKTKDVNEVCSY